MCDLCSSIHNLEESKTSKLIADKYPACKRALFHSAQRDNLVAMKYLIEQCNFHIDTVDDNQQMGGVGSTALHWANGCSAMPSGKSPNVIRYLLEKGASTTIKNAQGFTPGGLADSTKRENLIPSIQNQIQEEKLQNQMKEQNQQNQQQMQLLQQQILVQNQQHQQQMQLLQQQIQLLQQLLQQQNNGNVNPNLDKGANFFGKK